ncbi:MAG: efflux transporter outer membrane subunit [Campylobacteraceae bacterium]|jgi:NodT family efflux transporter outer membrane factor (OMF) lipoprotein|nr:efflux transporter outer membrane subunit [Campylobacteraceae bacterium]
MKYIYMVTVVIFIGGCSIHPDALQSSFEPPKEFSLATSNSSNISKIWWQNFDAPTLNSLMEQALENNPDILIAYENIVQARLQLGISEDAYLPQISASGNTGGSQTEASGSDARTSRSTSATLRISYEIDLWGKIAANNEQAQARFNATKHDTDAAILSLYASVAQSYFSLLSTNERLKIAKDNLNISSQLMQIVEAKYKSGSVSLLDVSRQKSSLLSQQANVDSLILQAAQAKNALAVLTGSAPQGFDTVLDSFWDLSIPTVEAGLPSELLLNRPDIAHAKANLEASNAAIKSASADRFPSFSLSGSGGLSSDALLSFKDPTSILSLVLNAAYTIFDGGRLNDLTDAEISKAKSAVQSYNKAILTALQESDDALLNVAHQTSQETLQKQIAEESLRSLDIASIQYRHGSADLTTLLDAQNKYFSSRDSLAVQRLNHLNAVVTLYKVLGGGWNETGLLIGRQDF